MIGVWSTASRQSITVRTPGKQQDFLQYVQVSRLGQPLVNEVVIPMGVKDTFNSIPPSQDAAALPFVLDPEVPKLLKALFGINSPPAPRNDLVTIFLKGIPGLNQPPKVKPVRDAATQRRDSAVGVSESARRARWRHRGIPERPQGW